MQCHQCARSVQPGDRFCTGCGTPLDAPPDVTPDAPPGVTADAPPDVTADAPPGVTPDAPPDVTPGTVTPDDANVLATAELPATQPHPTATPDTATPDTAELPATAELQTASMLGEVGDEEEWDDPVWAVTGAVPETPSTTDLPATEPVTEVWMAPTGPAAEPPLGTPDSTSSVVTSEFPTTTPVPTALPVRPPARDHHRFRVTAITFIGIAGGLALLVAMFATVVEVSSSDRLVISPDAPEAFRVGSWIPDDLGGNLSIAGLLASLTMVVGGVAAAFGWRWGSGLVGGGGLASAGLAALVVGLAQFPIDAAHEFAQIPSEQAFTLTITRALGYWLAIVAGAIGVVAFFVSTNDAFGDRRAGLNPWFAALGALAVVVATAGPLIPDGTAIFSDNWYVIERPGEPPAMLVAMRLVQLALLALGGVIGFLSVRRWGIGAAAGATLPTVWLGISTLFDIGTRHVGPGYRNPGADSADLHGVTIIGISAILAMTVLAAIAAYDQSMRER